MRCQIAADEITALLLGFREELTVTRWKHDLDNIQDFNLHIACLTRGLQRS